ncbi:MAG: hypothetical protein ACI9G1_005787 [Pirellulaceae bacterium]|jgi:hypothetical protein
MWVMVKHLAPVELIEGHTTVWILRDDGQPLPKSFAVTLHESPFRGHE